MKNSNNGAAFLYAVVLLAVVAAEAAAFAPTSSLPSRPRSSFLVRRQGATGAEAQQQGEEAAAKTEVDAFDGYDCLSQSQTELAFKDLVVGDGDDVLEEGKVATIAYTGRLMSSGKQFDQGPGYAFRLGDGNVVPGWEIGLRVSVGVVGFRYCESICCITFLIVCFRLFLLLLVVVLHA